MLFLYFSDWDKNGHGCVFDHFGKVPAEVYEPDVSLSDLELAVYENDIDGFERLVKVLRII